MLLSTMLPRLHSRAFRLKSLSVTNYYRVAPINPLITSSTDQTHRIQQQQQCRNMMALTEPIHRRAKSMVEKHQEIVKAINDLNNSDEGNSKQKQKKMTSLSKELSKLTPLAKQYEKMSSIQEEKEAVIEFMEECKKENDVTMEEECKEEFDKLEIDLEVVEKKISNAVLPVEEDDYYANAILEIRAGTGGDEAAHFASELLSSYEKTVKDRGWKFEVLTLSRNDLGGVREAAIAINSNTTNSILLDEEDSDDSIMRYGPYGFLKFESGVHRVQRVPVNDVRIHTSTASVAILPASSSQSNSLDLLPTSEIKIETMRSSGAGGQHVNTTESAVRVTHIPTGITASIQDERSQHKNKAKAINLITARVRNKIREEEAKKLGETRKLLMGGGERSERIRTYNFPQDRVTDHRVKHTEHGIENLINGGMQGLVPIFSPLLVQMHREELLDDLESEFKNS